MDSDVVLVLGIIIGALSIPAVISAFSDSRPPRAAIIAVVVSGGLILGAIVTKPGGYSAGQIPEVFTRVIAGIFR
ncbi:hypothetical protein [Phaeovulum sp.]|uniref:hypothetical protein n=1 Tax=Phaeovulum sp. TaxID=2934796 RepID=UPI0039E45B70